MWGSGNDSVRPVAEREPCRKFEDVVYSSDLDNGDVDGAGTVATEKGDLETYGHGTVAVADGEDADGEDQARPKIMRRPYTPSRQEVEEHMVSHMPFRAWCPHCCRQSYFGNAFAGW